MREWVLRQRDARVRVITEGGGGRKGREGKVMTHDPVLHRIPCPPALRTLRCVRRVDPFVLERQIERDPFQVAGLAATAG